MKFFTFVRVFIAFFAVCFAVAQSTAFAVGTPSWSSYKSGTLIASLKDKKLYHILSARKVVTYPIGIPRRGAVRTMNSYVSRKKLRPGWTPTRSQRRRDKKLPRYVKGGSSKNPLGAAALYLGGTVYRIHGTNEPRSIGRSMSDGCVHMRNRDILRLYGKVRHRARVIITWKSFRRYRVASSGSKIRKIKDLKRAKTKKKAKAAKVARAKKKADKAKARKRAKAKKKAKAAKVARAKKKADKAKARKRAKAKKKAKAAKVAQAKKKADKAKARKRAKTKKKVKAAKVAQAKKKADKAKARKRAKTKKKARAAKVIYAKPKPIKKNFESWTVSGELY